MEMSVSVLWLAFFRVALFSQGRSVFQAPSTRMGRPFAATVEYLPTYLGF